MAFGPNVTSASAMRGDAHWSTVLSSETSKGTASLASIAPRPLLVVAPSLDRDACFADVKTCVDEANKVYRLLGKENNLNFSGPKDYNHFQENRQQEILDWLAVIKSCPSWN